MKWLFNARNVQIQKGGQGNVQNIGVPPDLFIQEMQRKDDDIKRLIADKEALKDQLHIGALERQTLARDLADLRSQHEGLTARLANPAAAYAEHQQRSSQIEQLLHDAASDQSIGESRIRSALEAFKSLEYDEIDALLAETEQSGILIAAKAAYGQGLIAEEAVKWHDAYTHYKRAATLSDDLTHLKALAHMTWRLGKTNEGLSLHQRICEVTKAKYGAESPHHAQSLNNLAEVNMQLREFSEAEVLLREVTRIDLLIVGIINPDHATHLNNLASALFEQQKYDEAERFQRDSLAIYRSCFRTGSASYSTGLHNLATIVLALGRYQEAETLCREALRIDADTIGTNHPDYARHLNTLATVLMVKRDWMSALELVAKAFTIFRDVLTDAHQETQMCAEHYLLLLETQDTISRSPETTAKIASLKALLAP